MVHLGFVPKNEVDRLSVSVRTTASTGHWQYAQGCLIPDWTAHLKKSTIVCREMT